MANMSSAHGKYRFYVGSDSNRYIDLLFDLIKLFDRNLSVNEYGTYLVMSGNEKEIRKTWIKENLKYDEYSEKYFIETEFFGNGCWSYETNLENIGYDLCLSSDGLKDNKNNKYGRAAKEFITKLGNDEIIVECEMDDLDLCMDMFYHGNYSFVIDKTGECGLNTISVNTNEISYKTLKGKNFINQYDFEYFGIDDTEDFEHFLKTDAYDDITEYAKQKHIDTAVLIKRITDYVKNKIKTDNSIELALHRTAIEYCDVYDVILHIMDKI